jgi:hypothetical protein
MNREQVREHLEAALDHLDKVNKDEEARTYLARLDILTFVDNTDALTGLRKALRLLGQVESHVYQDTYTKVEERE